MSYVIIALAILLGSAIVGATFAYFIRARRVETKAGRPSNIASAAAPVPVAKEVEAIGEQIEKAMADHRFQGETQRQLIAQKLETVRHSVEAQKNQVQGLRSEFIHESRRRDHEIATIRTQIGTIQETVGLPPSTHRAALPPAPPTRVESAEPAVEDDEGLSFPLPDPSLTAEPDPAPSADVVVATPFEDTPFEDIVFAESPVPAPAAPPFEEASFSEETFATSAAQNASARHRSLTFWSRPRQCPTRLRRPLSRPPRRTPQRSPYRHPRWRTRLPTRPSRTPRSPTRPSLPPRRHRPASRRRPLLDTGRRWLRGEFQGGLRRRDLRRRDLRRRDLRRRDLR